jgi:hypothetical protein
MVTFSFLFVTDSMAIGHLLFAIHSITVANGLLVIDSLSAAGRMSKTVEMRKETEGR